MNEIKWNTITISGEETKRTILCSFLESFIIGSQWNTNSTKVFFKDNQLNNIKEIISKQNMSSQCKWGSIKENNWMDSCRDFFKPIVINNKVNIIPNWTNEDNRYINIKINPALAFGTGHHETTYMMIDSMLSIDIKDKTIIDIGTGSGILSILAYKLKAQLVYAIDNDELVYKNFYENVELNNIENSLDVEIRDCLTLVNFNYDVILANIHKTVLIDLLNLIKEQGKYIILSGILHRDEKEIETTLASYNRRIISKLRKKEWSCIIAK